MGIAILSGILSSLQDLKLSSSSGGDGGFSASASGTTTPAEELPSRLPSRFIACVRRSESAKRIRTSLAAYGSAVTVLQNENLRAVKEADIILLGCKPQMVSTILGDLVSSASDSDRSSSASASASSSSTTIGSTLQGKLLISICAGVPVSQIEELLYGSASDEDPQINQRCRIVRVMPNTASIIRESMTVIATPTTPLPAALSSVITWIFGRIGRVVHLPGAAMDASTALCGSGPAFFALVLEALADGAVAMGLPRAEAQLMAAQTMRGTSGMVLAGEHPALVREKVGTPGGCTIGGLLVLEEGRVRGTVARAVREATVVASQLGRGVEGVNGTRF